MRSRVKVTAGLAVAATIAQVCDQSSENLPFNSAKASLAMKIITPQ